MSGLEPTVARVLTQAGQKLFTFAKKRRDQIELRTRSRTLVPTRVAEGLLAELGPAGAHRLNDYLASPEFEEIALQFLVGRTLHDVSWEKLRTNIRHELRHGLRNAGISVELLVTASDVVFDALATAAETWPERHRVDLTSIATTAHLTAAAAANSALLREVGDVAKIHEFAQRMRAQVMAMHSQMRLPHLGVSKSVPYDQLYVKPTLRPEHENWPAPDPSAAALPGQRIVILGDPGAGKSTLAAKFAHDVAADRIPGAEGRVPFLLVLRNFAGTFRAGGKSLAHYLELVCADPYNLTPPPHAVEYLLRNGQAMVLLDGMDELVEPELRRKFVQLVDGFVTLFPLVPMLVTARRIGYSEAPLDRGKFSVGLVAELTEEQIAQYTQRWFALDDGTAEADRSRMAASFLRESGNITDLRANPLLLALLCAMYSSEHYIPANLAQVYERCAVMLFDRWDHMRGIADAPQFVGRLRGAVQHLAWQLFQAEESGKALARHRIVGQLLEHLTAKGFDEDDAIDTAEQFVEFCTGRAWILSDVGATDTEPRYGFTHRTFMEYFAAEHLVRTHPTAGQLWEVLRTRVPTGDSEVVAQIALQLLERNVDGGADTMLWLILADAAASPTDQGWLYTFAAQTLGYLHPRHDVIRDVTTAVLHRTLAGSIVDRYHYWYSDDIDNWMKDRDTPLYTLMYDCSPGNLPAIKRAVVTLLSELIETGSDTARFVALNLSRSQRSADQKFASIWANVQRELGEQHAAALTDWSEKAPWADLLHGVNPADIVARFGAGPLYLGDALLVGTLPSFAKRLLTKRLHLDDNTVEGTTLCDTLLACCLTR